VLVIRILRRTRAGVMRNRIEVSVAEELERRAVEAVRTALCQNADDCGRVTPKLRTVVVGDNVELADGIRIGNLIAAVTEGRSC